MFLIVRVPVKLVVHLKGHRKKSECNVNTKV